ncbi:MAG: DEAD/DEAH box helicase family protein [Candidatus Methanomethylicia archaeon]
MFRILTYWMVKLIYDKGTILIDEWIPQLHDLLKWDQRVKAFRAFAVDYFRIKSVLEGSNIEFEDYVLEPIEGSISLRREYRLRGYQEEALKAWLNSKCRGIIVLPTGTGKTIVGIHAIAKVNSSSLIIAPTIELIYQWRDRLIEAFNVDIGIYGGGEKKLSFITVSTYDSAYLNAEYFGNKFKLIVFDEVHHLVSEGYRQIAELNAAPFRLGLTATPEREDGKHVDLPLLVGNVVYSKRVKELTGSFLSPFRIVRIPVELTSIEKEKYNELTSIYKGFLKSRGLKIRSLNDFQKLILRSGLDNEARQALLAWHESRIVALNAEGKIKVLKDILAKHRGEKIIVFTEYNDVVHRISRELLIPEITHKTISEERERTLRMFRDGVFNIIATSKVLEEGIDVPDASIAIIISGTGSRREFIQRLGRILRPKNGKQAILYEIVTKGTLEARSSRKRRKALEPSSEV